MMSPGFGFLFISMLIAYHNGDFSPKEASNDEKGYTVLHCTVLEAFEYH